MDSRPSDLGKARDCPGGALSGQVWYNRPLRLAPLEASLGFPQAVGKLVLFPPDERDRVQKKTFTKWVNKHLIKVSGACL